MDKNFGMKFYRMFTHSLPFLKWNIHFANSINKENCAILCHFTIVNIKNFIFLV